VFLFILTVSFLMCCRARANQAIMFSEVLSEKLVEIALFYRFRRRMELKKTAQSYNFVFVCVEYRLMARKVRSFINFLQKKDLFKRTNIRVQHMQSGQEILSLWFLFA